MKCHIGVDAGAKYAHTITTIAVNVHDIKGTHNFLREMTRVYPENRSCMGFEPHPRRSQNRTQIS